MLPLLAATLPSVVKGIAGISQAQKGKAMARANTRPVYTRPVEVDQGLALAEQGYYNGAMPGQDALEGQIRSNTAGAITQLQEGASSSADLLSGINKINTNSNALLSEAQVKAAQWKLGQKDNLTAALRDGATYSDQEFDYNQHQPYQDRAAYASSMIGAGNQNFFGALSEGSQLAMATMGGGTAGGATPAGTVSKSPSPLMPTFKPYNPSAVLSTKMTYNPFTKKSTIG